MVSLNKASRLIRAQRDANENSFEPYHFGDNKKRFTSTSSGIITVLICNLDSYQERWNSVPYYYGAEYVKSYHNIIPQISY